MHKFIFDIKYIRVDEDLPCPPEEFDNEEIQRRIIVQKTCNKLRVVKSDFFDNWYVIERDIQDCDLLSGFIEVDDFGSSYYINTRIGDATVEGTLEEMQEIAKAIRNRKDVDFRRCAVEFCNSVRFYSPRNSNGDFVTVPLESADSVAEQIENLS